MAGGQANSVDMAVPRATHGAARARLGHAEGRRSAVGRGRCRAPAAHSLCLRHEQGVHARDRQRHRRRRGRRAAAAAARGRQELHHAARLRAPARRAAAADRRRAAEGGRGGALGGEQRRPLGERRLHLRQEAAARDRPPHPLPHQAAGDRRGDRPELHHGRDQVFFGATVTYAEESRAGAHHHHPGHRRGRQRARAGELDLADRARAAEGARRRRGEAGDAGGGAGGRGAAGGVSAQPKPRPREMPRRLQPGRIRARPDPHHRRRALQVAQHRLQVRGRAPTPRSAGRSRPARARRPCRRA
jgi:hypothetical protein